MALSEFQHPPHFPVKIGGSFPNSVERVIFLVRLGDDRWSESAAPVKRHTGGKPETRCPRRQVPRWRGCSPARSDPQYSRNAHSLSVRHGKMGRKYKKGGRRQASSPVKRKERSKASPLPILSPLPKPAKTIRGNYGIRVEIYVSPSSEFLTASLPYRIRLS